jgi:hypothetical protein
VLLPTATTGRNSDWPIQVEDSPQSHEVTKGIDEHREKFEIQRSEDRAEVNREIKLARLGPVLLDSFFFFVPSWLCRETVRCLQSQPAKGAIQDVRVEPVG